MARKHSLYDIKLKYIEMWFMAQVIGMYFLNVLPILPLKECEISTLCEHCAMYVAFSNNRIQVLSLLMSHLIVLPLNERSHPHSTCLAFLLPLQASIWNYFSSAWRALFVTFFSVYLLSNLLCFYLSKNVYFVFFLGGFFFNLFASFGVWLVGWLVGWLAFGWRSGGFLFCLHTKFFQYLQTPLHFLLSIGSAEWTISSLKCRFTKGNLLFCFVLPNCFQDFCICQFRGNWHLFKYCFCRIASPSPAVSVVTCT